MGLTIRAVRPDELEELLRAIERADGGRPTPARIEEMAAGVRPDRMLGVFDGHRMVGGTGSDILALTLPGGRALTAARVTNTALLPDYRGRGIGTSLMATQLADFRRRSEPLVIATTLTQGQLLRRFGFEVAVHTLAVEASTGARSPGTVTDAVEVVTTVGPGEAHALLPALFERHRLGRAGQVLRTDAFWRAWLADPERHWGEAGPRTIVVHGRDGAAIDGYLTYRRHASAPGILVVEEIVTATDEARRALWRHSLGLDGVDRVHALNVPLDEPLPWMVADPRAARAGPITGFLWLRLLDVAACLAARRYEAVGSVVFEVHDRFCSPVGGRFRLDSSPEGATCRGTTEAADIALDARDVAAAYLGAVRLRTLAAAGRSVELRPGSLAQADALFATREPPWCVTDW